jgi:molybdopterin-guanine dinucleotide biosynthesis protein A
MNEPPINHPDTRLSADTQVNWAGNPALSLVIQAGGASQRMGQDKGLMLFCNQPLVARLLERLEPLAEEVLVTTNNPQAYAFLSVRLVADRLPGLGALSGLYTALMAANCPLVAVVACDMPFASATLFSAECELLQSSDADLVIPRSPIGLEPFHAIYRRDTCLPPITAAMQAGERRVTAWYSQVSVRYLTRQEIMQYDPTGLAFLNVNNLDELREAEALARERGLC